MTMKHIKGKFPGTVSIYLLCIVLFYPIAAKDAINIMDVTAPKGILGTSINIICKVLAADANITWLFNEKPVILGNRTEEKTEKKYLEEKDVDGSRIMYRESVLTIKKLHYDDDGNYTCVALRGDGAKSHKSVYVTSSFPGRLVTTSKPQHLNVTDRPKATLACIFEIYKPGEVTWWKTTKDGDEILGTATGKHINLTHIETVYELNVRNTEDNGTYVCEIWDHVAEKNLSGMVDVFIYAPPKLIIDKVIPISSSQLYFVWTVFAFNSPIKHYNLWIVNNSNSGYVSSNTKVGVTNTSFVLEGLSNATNYSIALEVVTAHGTNRYSYPKPVRTLEKDPVFIPQISINGFSATSVTIDWPAPPDEIAELIHYYLLEARKKNETTPRRAYHSRDGRNIPYMFGDLEPHSLYVFRVCACQYYTGKCGNWSKEMEAATLDGIPGQPSNVTVECLSHINLSWQAPLQPNAEIKGYTMELTGNATYKDRFGILKQDMWGPLSKFKTNDSRTARFDDLRPNTNYTIKLSAMTRTRRRGDEAVRHCYTPPAPPAAPPRPRWRKIATENNRYMFKLHLPRISERNGPICCYRVYVVRLLPHNDWNNLPPPRDLGVIQYEEAHAVTPVLGAYATDVFSNEKFPQDGEILIGDGNSIAYSDDVALTSPRCRRCVTKPHQHRAAPTTTTTTTTEADDLFDEFNTEDPVEERPKRSYLDEDRFFQNPMMRDSYIVEENVTIKDGGLDSEAQYTLFVELIPGQEREEPIYSEYLPPLTPAAGPIASANATALEIALQVTCAVAALILLLMIVFCVLQTRRSRKLPPVARVEPNFMNTIRYMFGNKSRRQQATPTLPPDIPSIAKEDLAAAYAERQADSDYGFQKEFELLQMLPDCLPDRTTHASEARENQAKNRYPDIKAYDQTRVKLSQIDGIAGSDYINANKVMGYMERKEYICAQGPTDTTVNDFWRMIWERGLELIVMLTNLEEYSKVKCSKYWPDEVRGSRQFGAITVHHVGEKRYSDYIVRELKITKQPVNSEGQPLVENNGIAKRNGDCKDAESSAPTSPREIKDGDARIVRQYHFLMWKDFAAPEYPHSILKFIKRVNEAWSLMVGRPIVVHCSAGVGRTGTLVALDWLLEQLAETGTAPVLQAVWELRQARNFLVQSLKQYVFVYRALVEWAHYGDTEIPASQLKGALDRLRSTPDGASTCRLEAEFQKLLNPPVSEPVKSCAAGAAEEVRSKNRSQDLLPYDRNRVILTPIPGRDFSTYINASFIEAYDNSEGFIITQDPLPNTIADFWRMVSEHNVSTIVMLSEFGEGKCPRYWEDGLAVYEHVSVQYAASELCPYYTRRQFTLTDNKSGEVSTVRHLQYQGWPTAPGHVPEVTRGLAELCAAACQPPLLVHCLYGTERAPLFVALCTLVSQLRAERRVDVSCVARKVRAQRAGTIDTFLQYEFLHRAILNYAELHNLLEDS